MAVTAYLYGQAVAKAFNKEINWSSDNIKAMLCTSSYSPDQDAHAYKSDVTSEASGTGYTAGGALLTSKTVTYVSATNKVQFKAANVSWPNSTVSARYVVVYDDSPSLSTDKALIGYIDLGATESSSSGTFEIVWNSAGVFEVTAS